MIERSSAARPEPLEGLLSSLESLADPTRLRLLRLLETRELGVALLCEILQLPQSTVSRHLKVLGDLGFVKSRAQGTNRLYRMVRLDKDAPPRRLWLLARDQTDGWATARQDDLRLARALDRAVPAAQVFFAGAAGRWDKLREEAYGRLLNQSALGALLPPSWTVADLGCGTGALAAALSPHVARVIGVDQSAAMLQAARRRLAKAPNVELHKGRLEALPVEDASCDAALLVLALSYASDPEAVIAEMVRILKPGGRAVILDLLRHDREDFRLQMGHLGLGFDPAGLVSLMRSSGLPVAACRELAPEASAKGPALVLATAERPLPGLRAVPDRFAPTKGGLRAPLAARAAAFESKRRRTNR
jgi:ArsR family transcriptional regulator